MQGLFLFFRQAWEKFLNFIFPVECINCNQEGFYVCPECLKQIKKHKDEEFSSENIEKIYCLSYWNNALTEKIVKKFKFRFAKGIVQDLQPFFEETLKNIKLPANSVLIPVPLHRIRFNQRGFNQSELLADVFGRILNLPMEKNLIQRVRNTFPQSKLTGEKRLLNLIDAFKLNKKIVQKYDNGVNFILIDDVVVSCSTLEECAKPLKKEGFRNILAIVLARGGL